MSYESDIAFLLWPFAVAALARASVSGKCVAALCRQFLSIATLAKIAILMFFFEIHMISILFAAFQMKSVVKLKGHEGAVMCMDAWQDLPTHGHDAGSPEAFKSLKDASKYCKLRVLSGGIDGRVCMWDGRKGKLLRSQQAHTGGTPPLACACLYSANTLMIYCPNRHEH